jgi:hypothetical protein
MLEALAGFNDGLDIIRQKHMLNKNFILLIELFKHICAIIKTISIPSHQMGSKIIGSILNKET